MAFGAFVSAARERGELVVQPRMGFAAPVRMRAGLLAVRAASATTAGTITLDSFTRVRQYASARDAIARGIELNGFPLVSLGPETTRTMLEGVHDDDFPVQVRHGAALAHDIVESMLAAGLHATEGGPVSYCLPYGRTPLRDAVADWARCCETLADADGAAHLESFGGCMLGQLCPPSLLVALTLLEALFFRRHGIRSLSLSYAQQTHTGQDLEALGALRALAGELLPDVEWHVVLYTYMGVFPRSRAGAEELLSAGARLAAWSGAERLIVKTVAEADRIPTVGENVEALELAAETARRHRERVVRPVEPDSGLLAEARRFVDVVLDLHDDIGQGLIAAFERGYLDVPYCLHPDNANRARAVIDRDGRLVWADTGAMPIRGLTRKVPESAVGAGEILRMLGHVRDRFDRAHLMSAASGGLDQGITVDGGCAAPEIGRPLR
ncbi:methylaspartate mutase [Actinoallomurus sp. NPDC050550]|uniref:methylaspartate mutase n=1 Tax=Actinoallomurus sp. NPDC050550 TaxID=3154937 RepID=UPI003405FAEF